MLKPLLLAALAAAAALAAHLPFLSAEPLWDDEEFLAGNPAASCAGLGPALDPRNLVKISPVPLSARPAVLATLAADACAGAGPRGMKATNALLHAFNAALAFFVVYVLFGSAGGALFGALAFALHPAAAEAVHVITFRSHLLGFFFCAAGLLAALFYARRPGPYAAAAAALCYLLGLLSVETAAALPAAAAAAVAFDSSRAGLRRCAPLLAAAVLIAGFYLWFRAPRSGYDLPGSAPGIGRASALYPAALLPPAAEPPEREVHPAQWRRVYEDPAARAWTMSAVALRQLAALPFPAGLSPDYAPPVLGAGKGLPALLALLLLAGAAARLALAGRPAGLACALIFITLLPALNLWPAYNLRADRYLYFPLLGLAALAGSAWTAAARADWRRRNLALGAGALWLGWLAASTLARGPVFSSNLGLFREAARLQPASARAQSSLGAALLRRGDCASALPRFEAAAALDPGSAPLLRRLEAARARCAGIKKAAQGGPSGSPPAATSSPRN